MQAIQAAIENQAAPATPSSLDDVPADAVAVIAAYAGFFDRAKLAVCGKLISQSCAKVTSELLIVQNFVAGDSSTREVYVGDDSHWRRCADPPNNFWSVDQTVCIDGRACVGCTASRELYKSRGELFPDVYDAAAPPAWLQEMPVCLTQPWYSTWTDGAYEGTDYGRYASRMSHIEWGRFCVVKA